MIVSEIDLEYLESERRHMTTYEADSSVKYNHVGFSLNKEHAELTRYIDPNPFVPALGQERDMRCNEILTIQAMGLRKRLDHIGCKTAVIGISGGLDSTLAFLVIAKAFDYLNLDRNGIIAVTMPGFGTTDRTYENAVGLIKEIGASFMEVNISKAVKQHFADICHDENAHDVTYENSQARERTQILMDIANKENGIVIGTGDLSELALGWATYNGDHMSMYAVNSSVPKTLVRYLVQYYADTTNDRRLRETLYDILDTPVSPELLPPDGGEITQKTEDLVGPYELHDFFLYHMLRLSQSPGKIYRLAKIAFTGEYSDDVILKWEKTFYRRFFAQQFKRSCLPDGPKVGSVAVSPRGDLRMPSDACVNTWLEELDNL
jgi:NAD+ synthase (glutamine-hydrolysing)